MDSDEGSCLSNSVEASRSGLELSLLGTCTIPLPTSLWARLRFAGGHWDQIERTPRWLLHCKVYEYEMIKIISGTTMIKRVTAKVR